MTIWRLVMRELWHRKVGLLLSLLAVLAAVSCAVGAVTLLRAYDQRTEQVIAGKEAELKTMMAQMQDEYRKITLRLGFNILILPKDQNLGDFFAEDYAARFMPEDYADKLANSRIVTVQHLLPSLQQKVRWPEQQRTIILIGTRGEVPLMHRDPKSPLQPAVESDSVVVGHELHTSLDLAVGDTLTLMGRPFKVARLQEARGNKDDVTLWIHLAQAQELLDKKGLITGILALDCTCNWSDLPQVRQEITGILPDTQVIEFRSQALARAEARMQAAQTAQDLIETEKHNRARLRNERESFAAILVPLVVLASAVWVGFLALANVRDRRTEIGILRAVGLRSRQILCLFLTKAALIGLIGAALGFWIGLFLGLRWENSGQTPVVLADVFSWPALLLVLLLAPLLSALASWIPALLAAQQDPAVILRDA